MMHRGRIIHKYVASGENQTDERFSSIQSHHNTQLKRLKKNDDNRFDQESRKHMPLIAITHNNTGWRNRSSQSTTRCVDDDLGTKQQSKRGSAESMQITACSNTSDMEPEATEDNKGKIKISHTTQILYRKHCLFAKIMTTITCSFFSSLYTRKHQQFISWIGSRSFGQCFYETRKSDQFISQKKD